MTPPALHVVTGAFGFSGARIARKLLERGHRVVTLTGHPNRPHPLRGSVEARPFRFDDPDAMAAAMDDAAALYNTYWIRFERGDRTFEGAVRNTRSLFAAAERAGVGRIVHVSITNPSLDSPLPYFRGKARVEEELRSVGLDHSILRPALLFGRGDVLINNIAWCVRRVPAFPVPGDGSCPVRPIHVDDLAELAVAEGTAARGEGGPGVQQGDSREERGLAGAPAARRIVDAVGPDAFTLEGLVRTVARALGRHVRIVHAPARAVHLASRLLGRIVGDVVLTGDEVRGLTRGLLGSDAPPAGSVRLSDWLRRNRGRVGRSWASELERHYEPAERS